MKLTKTTFLFGCAVGGMSAALAPLLLTSTQAETKLLPFQGRLTDADGKPIAPDQVKVVEFKMYDAPTGGAVKWAGEVHKLSVNGGLVNTMLGSKATLGGVDFSLPTYLQITIDANNDGHITAADPPLLPRQSVVPTIYAAIAGQIQYVIPAEGTTAAKVGSAGWEAVFDNGRPDTGRIPGGKLAGNSVQTAQIAAQSVTSDKIADGTITVADLSAALQQAGLIPPGTIVAFGGVKTQVPPGWLLCDGSALSSTQPQYTPLFQKIQTNWGNGAAAGEGANFTAVLSGSDKTDFNLPDLRGYFLRGVDATAVDPDGAGRVNLLNGGSIGRQVGSYQDHQFTSHNHNEKRFSTPDHYHVTTFGSSNENKSIYTSSSPSFGQQTVDGPGLSISGIYFSSGATRKMDFTSGPYVGGNGSATGSNDGEAIPREGGNETRPKNAYVNYIIKL